MSLCGRLFAKWISWVDTEPLEIIREKTQLIEGAYQRIVIRPTVHLGVEERGGESAILHVTFELGHVDPIGGENAHGLVERRRQVPDPEDGAGDTAHARRQERRDGVRGAYPEAGSVVGLVL